MHPQYASNPWAARAALMGAWGGISPGGQMLGFHEDEDDDEDMLGAELDAIENELDYIEGEVDNVDDDYMDGWTILGALGDRQTRKIHRLEARLARVEDKISRTSRARKRRRLEKKAEKIRMKIERIRVKLSTKLTKAVRKGKIDAGTATAIAAGAGAAGMVAGAVGATMMAQPQSEGPGVVGRYPGAGPAAPAYSMEDYPSAPFTGRVPPSPVVNQSQRTPSAGEEVRLPLLSAGSPVFNVQFPANAVGPPLQTVAVTVATPLIPYAAFQVTGIDVIINAVANPAALVNAILDFYGVSGDKNLLYAPMNVSFAGQTKGGPDSTSRRTINGLRENQILQPTNTVSANLTIRQEVNNAAAIDLSVEVAMVGRVIYDPAVRR